MQDFNIEKLQLLESEKAKIRKEYERREGQIEVKKKMLAPFSIHRVQGFCIMTCMMIQLTLQGDCTPAQKEAQLLLPPSHVQH